LPAYKERKAAAAAAASSKSIGSRLLGLLKANWSVATAIGGLILLFKGNEFYALSILATGVNAAGLDLVNKSIADLLDAYKVTHTHTHMSLDTHTHTHTHTHNTTHKHTHKHKQRVSAAIVAKAPELERDWKKIGELKQGLVKMQEEAKKSLADGVVTPEEAKAMAERTAEELAAINDAYESTMADLADIKKEIDPESIHRLGQQIYVTAMSALACGASPMARDVSQGLSIGAVIGSTLESIVLANRSSLEAAVKYGEEATTRYSQVAGSLLAARVTPSQFVSSAAGYAKMLGSAAGCALVYFFTLFAPTLSSTMMGGKLFLHSIEQIVDPTLVSWGLGKFSLANNKVNDRLYTRLNTLKHTQSPHKK